MAGGGQSADLIFKTVADPFLFAWQNGRVERFIGTVKRELATEPMADSQHFMRTLHEIRTWYNHGRPHDHLQGRTPAEVWAGIDVFATRPREG